MSTKSKLVASTLKTGTTTATFTPGQPLTLHGQTVNVIVTDALETIIQYSNGAQRTFRSNDLASYLELHTFPTSTRFTRPVEGGVEQAYIEHVLPDRYIMEVVGVDGLEPAELTSMTYNELMTWHMTGTQAPAERTLPGKLYLPKAQPPIDASVAELIKGLESEDDHPFETDLQKEVTRLQKELDQMEVRAQTTINSLTNQLHTAKADLLTQDGIHNTRLLAAADEVAALQRKVEALTNPPPTCKEVCTLLQVLHIPEMRKAADVELAAKLNEGWTPLNISISTEFTIDNDCHTRVVTFVRDLPTTPAPKVAATDAAIYSTPVPHPPVTPPMPSNQVIVPVSAAPVVSRALTNNVPKPGETKRIPTLASIQARREQDAAEINAILQRGQDAQESLRREFASKSNPFPVTGAQPS